jgi:hypothetical protein
VPMRCYGYPADLPPGDAKDAGAQPYQPQLRRMPYPCYSYPNICFSYPGDEPRDTPSRDVTPSVPPDLRQMLGGPCFRYWPALRGGTGASYPLFQLPG